MHFLFKSIISLALLFIVLHQPLQAQNYHAIYGSNYAGSLGIHNNPASMVSTPYAWDVNLFSLQLKNLTNAVEVNNFSLLSPSANSTYRFKEGSFKRYEHLNSNAHVLNARIALNRKSSIGFGMSMKQYLNVKASPFNFIDTLKSANDFLKINQNTGSFDADARGSGWAEMYFSYARTIIDNEMIRINAGATIKLQRGLAGMHSNVNSNGVQKLSDTGSGVYAFNQTNISYAYSSSIDRWKNNYSTTQNLQQLYQGSYGGAAVEGGIEYIIKTQAVTNIYDEDDYYDYTWKIGLSFLDLGFNQFYYGSQSRRVGVNKESVITGDQLDNTFKGVESLKEFNDSVTTIADSYAGYNGQFNIINPARMVVNVDRYLFDHFYVNGELTLMLSPLAGDKRFYVRETNLLAITPRWETKRWGAYMPLQVSTDGKFLMGGAIKAGPLLLGFHNLANVISKNKMQNGGGYLAFIIHPGSLQTEKRDRRLNCADRP